MGQAGVHGEPGGAASEEDAASSSDGQGSSYFSGEVLARISISPSPDNLPRFAVSALLTVLILDLKHLLADSFGVLQILLTNDCKSPCLQSWNHCNVKMQVGIHFPTSCRGHADPLTGPGRMATTSSLFLMA